MGLCYISYVQLIALLLYPVLTDLFKRLFTWLVAHDIGVKEADILAKF